MKFEDILQSVKSETDMKSTLSTLGIRVVKNAFLCPFHNDSHIGNCRILHKDYAVCFACNTGFDSIKLVQKVNAMTFREAVLFIYTQVLGYSVPSFEKQNSGCILNMADLRFIGVSPAAFTCEYESADNDEKIYLESYLIEKAREKRKTAMKKKALTEWKEKSLKNIGLYQCYYDKSEADLKKACMLISKLKKENEKMVGV